VSEQKPRTATAAPIGAVDVEVGLLQSAQQLQSAAGEVAHRAQHAGGLLGGRWVVGVEVGVGIGVGLGLGLGLGLLGCWVVGLSGCWVVGVLGCWAVGALGDCWGVGLLGVAALGLGSDRALLRRD